MSVSDTLLPENPAAFLSLLSDCLRLGPETVAMAFVYTNRYLRYAHEQPPADDLLDEHTLALASLSLATKATESPRRLREFLVPAYELLNPKDPPLTFPSPLYDALRSTLVTAELLLLRILKFDLRVPLPFDFLQRFLEKTLTLSGMDHLDYMRPDERAEVSVVHVKDTSLGRAVWSLVGETTKSYRLVNLFPARTVAVACFYICVQKYGLRIPVPLETWVKKLTGDRVEYEDFEEAVEEVRSLKTA